CQPISGLVSIINKKVVLPAISKIDHTNQSANGRLGLETSPIHGQPASHNPPCIWSDSGLSILTFTFKISELNQELLCADLHKKFPGY
ncbi:TPA: hypothetical protein ACF7AG_003712, partial [Salmonella enterica]